MKLLFIAAGIGSILFIAGLVWHYLFLRRQLRSLSRQLDKRLREHTRQPVRLELQSKELTTLAVHINDCLQAEETLRLKGIREEKQLRELIVNISHDLRTPLTAIKGYQQLVMNGKLEDNQRKKLLTAQKHAEVLGELIDRFFEYSYLLQAELEWKRQRLNLANFTAECLALSVAALEEQQLDVTLEEQAPVFVLADEKALTRILQNLIRNAIQHANGELTVRVTAASRGILSFSNPVISSSVPEAGRLFDRFYTGDTARSSGSGLGLSIVRLLAEQMGGEANAVIENGILEIRIELPLACPSAAQSADIV